MVFSLEVPILPAARPVRAPAPRPAALGRSPFAGIAREAVESCLVERPHPGKGC